MTLRTAIESVRDKLIKQPNQAADKVVIVLEELAKVFGALNAELSKYLSVTFYEGQAFKEMAEERANLVELEGDQVCARLARALGHCNKITNIYNKYLSTWFHEVLTEKESDDLKKLFIEGLSTEL